MLEHVLEPKEKTLREFIANNYPDFSIESDLHIDLDVDITNGLEYERYNGTHYEGVCIYPYVKFTDGGYRPVYFDCDYRVTLTLSKRRV